MGKSQENKFDFEAMFNTWHKSMSDYWNNLAKLWTPDQATTNAAGNPAADLFGQGPQAAMTSALKNIQAFAKTMSTPDSMAALLKGAGAMPEILSQMAISAVGSFTGIQEKIVDQARRFGKAGQAYRFEDLDENIFRAWSDIYEKELQRFFYVPQIGLTRSYQEHWNEALDKFNLYQTRAAEFIRLLNMPFHRSLTVFHEKISGMAEEGGLPEDSQVYYQMWIKILEGHFMTLFQEPEYVQTLSNTITALADYTNARNKVFEDMIGMLPIPRQSELDDLAREVHELKKLTRKLLKQTKSSNMGQHRVR